MVTSVTTFLMFEGDAGAAMALYASVFPEFRVLSVDKYGPDQDGPEGTVRHATAEFQGQRIACIDSPIAHGFSFTPAVSLFVECESAEQLDRAFEALGADGKVFMPLDDYGFSKRFGWIADRFGVSWQLNLAS